MSTRANVVIKEGKKKLYFYRHSDGYPEGVADTLNQFMQWLKDGTIRDNLMQAAGWLVVIGHREYEAYTSDAMRWKAGAYEPTTGIHPDVEYIYTIDLETKTLKTRAL